MFYLNKFFYWLLNNNSIIIGGIIFFLCISFIYLSFFIHPSGDDYTYAFLELKSPFFSAYLDEYFLWNGRYFSNFFVLKNPLTFGFNNVRLYRVFVILIQLSLFISIYFSLSKFSLYFSKQQRLLFAGFLFLSYLLLIPALNEGFYWYTGMVTYQLAIIFFLIYIHFYFHKSFYLRTLILIFLQVMLIGFNEVSMLYLICFQFIYLVFTAKNFKIDNYILFITSVSFSFIVFMSPGNSVRASYFEGVSHQFFHSLLMSLLQVIRFFIKLNEGFFLFITAIIFYNLLPNIKLFIDNYRTTRNLFMIPTLIFVILFISIFPAYWTTGIMGQHRTVNFAFFICIPLLFFWFLLIINRFESFFITLFNKIKIFIVFGFIFSISLTRNLQGVFEDFSNDKHLKFNQQNHLRYTSLNNQMNQKKKDVYLKKLKTHPFSISIYDLSLDPNHLSNIGYQRYWKLKGKVYLIP